MTQQRKQKRTEHTPTSCRLHATNKKERMKHSKYIWLLSAGPAVLLASCEPYMGGYPGGNNYPAAYSSAGWSNARYDSAGIPVFGYYNAQPVYGYTNSGDPIFTLAALTLACIVPNWGFASWYRGSWRYPRYVVHRAAPPRYPAHHRPGAMPPANHPHNFAPDKRPNLQQPGNQNRPGFNPGASVGNQNRPGASSPRPNAGSRPSAPSSQKHASSPKPGNSNGKSEHRAH